MRFPWVSRRAFELQESIITRLQQERDEISIQRDRLADQLIDRFGFQPVSTPVRTEVAAVRAEVEKAASVLYEDAGSGMIAEEVLEMAAELGAPV